MEGELISRQHLWSRKFVASKYSGELQLRTRSSTDASQHLYFSWIFSVFARGQLRSSCGKKKPQIVWQRCLDDSFIDFISSGVIR